MTSSTNIIRPESLAPAAVAILSGDALVGLEKYLSDESRRQGSADAIAFPTTTAQVVAAVQAAKERNWPITVSAARTGIAAGAVPAGGLLLSLERLTAIHGLRQDTNGSFYVACQAGVSLTELQNSVRSGSFADSSTWSETSKNALAELKKQRLFYPPDPTETSAALGGTVACNASGAHTFLYGPTRPYVEKLTVVLTDGRILELARGQYTAAPDGTFGIVDPAGTTVWGHAPSYLWPKTKNSAGYFSAPELDLIDLFIGSEGTLGIITEVEVRLVPAPSTSCAVMTFWPAEQAALRFTAALRTRRQEMGVEAIEYVGPNALAMLRDRRRSLGAASGIPECLPTSAQAAIYLDIGADASTLPATLAQLAELVTTHGGDPETCWSAMERDERERLRVFRHALPETVNSLIAEARRTHPEITKLGTDMAVPDEHLERIMSVYREKLDAVGLRYVIFGHIGNNHLHVNILPQTPDDYRRGWELYHEFAHIVVELGGSPAAEHGIGKLKPDFLRLLLGDQGIEEMRAIKRLFDPDSRLGLGTLFAA
jgi:D-lactate dehydrogenase (cytochrome)